MTTVQADQLQLLAHDLWWTSQPDAQQLWHDLDPDVWEGVNHNPVVLLRRARLDLAGAEWHARAADLVGRWQALRARELPADQPKVAYFCMEFGLHESLPIFSGGLGMLAGDHLRSACDHNLDLVAVGLFYHQGYFKQVIHDDMQVAAYATNLPERLPVSPVLDADGAPIIVEIPHGHHTYKARAWEVRIGQVRLFLLDTDVEGNSVDARHLTLRLYGGDQHTRIAQEVLLGIGGVRLLRKLGLRPDVFHLNEGHSAFLCLELWAERLRAKEAADAAWSAVREQCVFTTHTPVPAGHDRFGWDVLDSALGGWREALGLPPGTLMDLGRVRPRDIHESLCMTVLALRGSRTCNGVSKLHGQVSREMWAELLTDDCEAPATAAGKPTEASSRPGRLDRAAPIGHITNGVHSTAWLAPETASLLDAHLPGWRDHLDDRDFWAAAEDLPRQALLTMGDARRRRLVGELRRRLGRQVLDSSALTIGFARRFAPYKRANLCFTDPDRLAAILDQGAQLVFAGKAHPADMHGQALVAEVIQWSHDPRFRRKVVFVPGYDVFMGRMLTSSCDVWLNNPRRPREASGTSGQKSSMNGNLNCSVLDGWWPEACDGRNGWAIGGESAPEHIEEQDAADAEALYTVLETQVMPLWRDREAWAANMAHAIATCMPVFNTHRMVRDYSETMYAAGSDKGPVRP